MSYLYQNGSGNSKNEAEAFRWNLKEALYGDILSQRTLAIRYEQGVGVTPDLTEAAKWYRQAADQGDDDAEDQFGYHLLVGRGVIQNQKQGFDYLLKASRYNVHARYLIADCYSKSLSQ